MLQLHISLYIKIIKSFYKLYFLADILSFNSNDNKIYLNDANILENVKLNPYSLYSSINLSISKISAIELSPASVKFS